MADSNFYVDVSPEMQLYKILQRQSYGIGTALAEFVDNSIQSFVDKQRAIKSVDGSDASLKILITIDSKKGQIVIEDNASGINRKDFQRAIRMGGDESFRHPSGSLSAYGIGMKSSAIWFSNTWSIETSALNSREKLTTTFDLDKLLASGTTEIEVKTDTEEIKKHYTKIVINNCLRDLEKKEEYFKDDVLPYLQETFFKFKDVSIDLVYDGLTLRTEKAFLATPSPLNFPVVNKDGVPISDESVVWRKTIDLNYAGRIVKGFIMIMDKGGYHSPGIRLLRNRRVILGTQGGGRQNKPGILLKTSNKYASQRFYGEISLNEFSVNFTKTDFDEDLNGLYRMLYSELSGDGSATGVDYLHQAECFRQRKSRKSEQEKADKEKADKEKTDKEKTGKEKTGKEKKTAQQSSKIENQIVFSSELDEMLGQLEHKKMQRLYGSLCTISLTDHPVLAYVGAWTLLESLATYIGKDPTTEFAGFYNGKINEFTKNRTERGQYKVPIQDIHSKGNTTKHSAAYDVIDARQLVSDFQSIEKFLVYCAGQAVSINS